MVWDPAIPATNADLLSAPVRDNFGALDTALMAALATLANGAVLTKAAGPVIAGIPAVATGAVLASAGVNTAPTWNIAPSLTSLTLSGLTVGSVLFAGAGGVLSQDNANFFFDDTNNNLRLFGGGVGTNGQRVLALGPSTAPTTFPVDTVQLYTHDADGEAGSRELIIRDERGAITEIGSNSTAVRLIQAPGTTVMELSTSPAGWVQMGTLTNHSVYLIQNNAVRLELQPGGNLTIDLVSLGLRNLAYGAVDTGGAGYRMLRVLN
jgi:hypothetical protein